MLTTATVREDPSDTEGVYAFHVLGEVSAKDMKALAVYMNEQFDRHETVSMMLIFDRYDGAARGANLDWSVIKSRVRALRKVRKYVVVNAPENVSSTVENIGSVIPVDVEVVETEEDGWAHLGARPLNGVRRSH